MTVDLRGRIALVTGAASGMGQAAAKLMAQNGATVAGADRNLPGAELTRDEITAAGGTAIALEVEMADAEAVQRAVDRTIEAFGKIDILVHCAGGNIGRKDVIDLSDEDWDTVIRANLYGTMFITRAVARTMVPRKTGTMLMITSDRGLLGDKSRSSYAASKGGMIAYMKSLALELGQYEITVNSINPGTTNSGTVRSNPTGAVRAERIKSDPLGKLSEPEDIAEMILFLTGPAAKFMTGQVITTRMRFG